MQGNRIHFDSVRRNELQPISSCAKKGPDLFGQGIVLSANKTAQPSLWVFLPSSAVNSALNAFGLFARRV